LAPNSPPEDKERRDHEAGATRVYSLCPNCSACPTVGVYDYGKVTIGEAPNLVTLQRPKWNELVKAIQSGALGAIA
jgi:hypothetical protein